MAAARRSLVAYVCDVELVGQRVELWVDERGGEGAKDISQHDLQLQLVLLADAMDSDGFRFADGVLVRVFCFKSTLQNR